MRNWLHATTLLGVAFAGAAIAIPDRAFAQQSEHAAAAARAESLFEDGAALYQKGRKQEAYERFRAAWGLAQTYDIAANLGVVELALGKHRDAAEHLSFALRVFPPSEDPKSRTALETRLTEARKQVGALRIRVDVKDAEILIDGAIVGRAPIAEELFVETGPHWIEARLAGYLTARRDAEGEKGISREIALSLSPLSAGQPAPAPLAPSPPSAVDAGGSAKSVPLIVVGIGATAAGIGLGTVAVLVANGRAADAQAIRDGMPDDGSHSYCFDPAPERAATCADLKHIVEDEEAFSNVAMWGFIGAGVFGVATTVYALWPSGAGATDRSAGASLLQVAPLGLPHGGGAVLLGRF